MKINQKLIFSQDIFSIAIRQKRRWWRRKKRLKAKAINQFICMLNCRIDFLSVGANYKFRFVDCFESWNIKKFNCSHKSLKLWFVFFCLMALRLFLIRQLKSFIHQHQHWASTSGNTLRKIYMGTFESVGAILLEFVCKQLSLIFIKT